MKRYYFIIFMLILCMNMTAQTAKEVAINNYRVHYSMSKHRGHELKPDKSLYECINLLQTNGKFSDLVAIQNELEANESHLSQYSAPQNKVSELNKIAYMRLWKIAESYRGTSISDKLYDVTLKKLYNGLINYGEYELSRANVSGGRFHTSCFAIPTAAVNTYFCLFELMDKVEKNEISDDLAKRLNTVLKNVGMQSWTQPYRNDATDENVVQVDRFRNHVWWVGGNGLAFRSVFPTSVMMSSVEMVDVLAEVARGGLSWVSQNTYDNAFWTEGFTADGAGWGHGMQCLIWGYPISGVSSALNLIENFKGTPWANQLDEENTQALINYYRGSSWYYYKGYIPRCLGRMSMAYRDIGIKKIKTDGMIRTTIDSWLTSYPEEEQKELMDLQKDINDYQINMRTYPNGYYTGTRWFFNNDNLIKKNPDYYTFVSMASIRCDGIEMAHTVADKYNFFTCDGMTFFMKDGNEYHQAIGAWNLTAVPGVTARQVDDNKLVPMTNWRGYNSKHNFAAAATNGGKNAAAGFIHEKHNASNRNDPNDFIYGIKSYKGYFMVDDYLVALGAGITNLNPDMEGDVWTTIDQTHYNGELQYYGGENVTEISGDFVNKLDNEEIVWAAQNGGFAYAVLPEYTTGEVFLTAETRNTKWEMINKSNEKIIDLPQSEDIFQMHINHGQEVQNGTYAYVVYAGKDDAAKALDNMPVQIIENSADLQAITWGYRYIGASFYNAQDTLKANDFEISVSAPCALLFEKSGDKYIVSVTDAEMNAELNAIKVSTTLPVRGENVKTNGKWNIITVPMHQDDMCGKPNTVEINIDRKKNSLPWIEDFVMNDSTTTDNGLSSWHAESFDPQAVGYAYVKNNDFWISGTNCNWESGIIDISEEDDVTATFTLRCDNPRRLSPNDSLSIFLSIDQGPRKLISKWNDNFEPLTFEHQNIEGDSLQIFIEGRSDQNYAAYVIDNIQVSKSIISISELSFENDTLKVLVGDTITPSLSIEPSNANTSNIIFSKLTPSLVTTNKNKSFRFLKQGEGKIAVSTEDGSLTDTLVLLGSYKYLPPWHQLSIGESFLGDAQISEDKITLTGNGQLSDYNDNLHYIYQNLTGDFSISGKFILSDDNTMAGFTARCDTASDSKKISVSVANQNAQFTYRSVKGQVSQSADGNVISNEIWLKLTREDGRYTGFESDDGINWHTIRSSTVTTCDTVMLGVFVSGAAYPSITTATVTNFEINNLSTNLKNITDSSIDVFPNPTNNSITITNNSKTRVTHIKLFNTNGKIISRENIQIEPREKGKIDIKKPGMTTGIYLLKIYHKDKSYIERIIYKN